MRRHGLTIATLRTGEAVFCRLVRDSGNSLFPQRARVGSRGPATSEGQAQGALEVDDQAPTGASAELERELIRERTRQGVARPQAEGEPIGTRGPEKKPRPRRSAVLRSPTAPPHRPGRVLQTPPMMRAMPASIRGVPGPPSSPVTRKTRPITAIPKPAIARAALFTVSLAIPILSRTRGHDGGRGLRHVHPHITRSRD